MFLVFKNNRPAGNVRFPTYEAARQYLRKRIRKLHSGWYEVTTGNNPTHTVFGYEIRRV